MQSSTAVGQTRPIHRIHHLRPALVAAGVYERATGYHVVWFATIVALYAGCLALLAGLPGVGLRALAIFGAAIAVMQLGLFAHEAGHGAIARSALGREILGQLSNSFLIGFGFSHWQATHPVHHNHPNTEGVDPDMESAGYALYEAAADAPPGRQAWIARWQPTSLFIGFLLWGFAIRVVAVMHAIRHFSRRTAVDLVCVAGHVALWAGLAIASGSITAMLINYALITVLNGIYMGAILVVPHVGLGSTARDRELAYFERQVRFSRNYDASLIGTLLCGGLNLQIEHHLLPGIPCMRLRRARPVIVAYCAQHDLPYKQTAYWTAWREVIAYGRAMAQRARQAQQRAREPAAAPTQLREAA